MFTKPIYSTMLTTPEADRLFSNVTVSGAFDSSFLSTMRVLLRNRIPENESVRLICKPRHFSENEIDSVSTSQALNWFIPEEIKIPTQLNHLIIIVYCTNQDSGTKMLELIRNNCGVGKRHMSNYALQEDLRIFYARKFSGLLYHSESDNKTVIFADKIECKQFHALQMMIPKYLPSLFKNSPLTDQETELLKSLGDKSAVNYERLIEAFATIILCIAIKAACYFTILIELAKVIIT